MLASAYAARPRRNCWSVSAVRMGMLSNIGHTTLIAAQADYELASLEVGFEVMRNADYRLVAGDGGVASVPAPPATSTGTASARLTVACSASLLTCRTFSGTWRPGPSASGNRRQSKLGTTPVN
jgi:hypothetical protein